MYLLLVGLERAYADEMDPIIPYHARRKSSSTLDECSVWDGLGSSQWTFRSTGYENVVDDSLNFHPIISKMWVRECPIFSDGDSCLLERDKSAAGPHLGMRAS